MVSMFFLLYTNDLPDVICAIAFYADDTTLYSECDQASDLRPQLELASELESGSTRHCGVGKEVACWSECWENSTGSI